ncbi:chagasin family peptidase inhibitor I42 [Herbihabitans rhizosphaerae]|uniref:Chagasin family peptidase inhibitor I42 n=1 Tax=Herbihabitans rhizosphaerae TaxID=1872711 RepID=A0A4Q7KCW1_9PSEU|nr:protease inhibitor I42 family protein [Herbihabitans rhizosphaerae]RZS30563.1 chagasin family peptidase inhibitor I42 [Herbihabitans rhizosphaerae]
MPRTVSTLVATCAVTLLAAGCSGGSDGESPAPAPPASKFGTEFTPTQAITVKPGEKFSVVVRSNASVGDRWSVRRAPDPRIAEGGKGEFVSDAEPGQKPMPGQGGRVFFVFTAKEKGSTTAELFNCFRGCDSPQDQAESTTHLLRIDVS